LCIAIRKPLLLSHDEMVLIVSVIICAHADRHLFEDER